jgi:DNA (cytosine-5)-methyltransferase 1
MAGVILLGVDMKLLDLFCGAGGAAMGYHRAGFEVVGVDINPQPNYPFKFHQANALDFPLDGFDIIHASPPCQAHTCLNVMWNAKPHDDFVEPTREKLKASGLPYIIENVPGAPLIDPIKLCGSMFGLGAGPYDLRRHRMFECSFYVEQPKCNHIKRKPVIGVYGDHVRCRRRNGDLPMALGKPLADEAMGIDWMNWRELRQSIPPAYTQYIGEQYNQSLNWTAKKPPPVSLTVI